MPSSKTLWLPSLLLLNGCILPLPIPTPNDRPAEDPVDQPDEDPVDQPDEPAEDPVEVDSVAPRLLSVDPDDGEEGVALAGIVVLEFDEELAPSSTDAVTLRNLHGVVDAEVWVDGSALVLEPYGPMLQSTEYLIDLAPGVRDLHGNATEGPLQSWFRAEDRQAPQLVESLPADGATGVAIEASVELQFDEPLDPGSVHAGSVRMVPLAPVDGQWWDDGLPGSLSVQGDRIVYTPDRGLLQEYETGYVVEVDGVRDAAGNAVATQVAFETEMVDPDSLYRIHNAQFHTVLDTYADSYGAHLADPSGNTSGSYWYFSEAYGARTLRNQYAPADRYLEGGGLGGSALMTDGGHYTGQHWSLGDAGAHQGQGAGQSPNLYWLTNNHEGPSVSLGVTHETSWGVLELGLEQAGWLDQAWYLTRAGWR
jgi:hypothetical protein